MMRERLHIAGIALVMLSACGPDAAASQVGAPAGDATVRFDLAAGPLPLGAVPYPSDVYRDDAGRITIGPWPNPESDGPMLTALRDMVGGRDGFCGTCNAIFVIDGGLLLPDDGPPDDPALSDPVVLVDIDSDSPDHGEAIPLRWQWEHDRGWLTVRPARGHALAPGRRYAYVVTDAALGGDGLPVGASGPFAAIRDGDDDVDVDPLTVVARAHAALDPALDALEEVGLPPGRVRGVAPFVTDDPADDLRTIRTTVRAGPPASATVDAVWSGEALDQLLGVPSESRPGVDVPPMPGVDGTRAVVHDTTQIVVAGRFPAPRFVGGQGTEIGTPRRDDTGRLVAEGTDDVTFVLIVPAGVDVSSLPVVVAHHGFNSNRTTGFTLADTAGRAGFAVLAIDAYQHGERAASRKDERNEMRGGIEGPDGFAETNMLEVSARVFGLAGAEPDMTLYPGYALGAFEQFAADAMATVRFAVDGDLRTLRDAHPALAGLAFDPDRIAYVGNSMGAVVGMSVVVAEPDVGAAVLDVLPGSIIETLAESGEFRLLSETLLLPRIGVETDFDEVERSMLFDPTVDFFRWALEPIDPLALAPVFAAAEHPPHLLVQVAGHDEVAAPPATESVLAAAGIPGVGEYSFAPVVQADFPLTGTTDTPAIAAVRFDGAMHGMLEVIEQPSAFLEPLVPPLQPRDRAADLRNPTVAIHAQIEAFLRTFAQTGGATILVPEGS